MRGTAIEPIATRRIAEFVVGCPPSAIPERAREVARQCILDCVAVAVAGLDEQCSRLAVEYVRALGARPVATVWGSEFRSSVQDAALANGVLAHAMDYDDSHSGACGHPSVALVPALLAIGEALNASGTDIVTAYVTAFEVLCRIGEAIGRDMFDHGFHATATWAPIGAAAGASRLLGLNVEQTVMALGIAASSSGGLFANFGTMTKPLHAGQGARAGVMAAQLAQAGFTANGAIFDDPDHGFLAVFGGKGHIDADAFLGGLGTDWGIVDRMQFKLHPSCARTHPGIDAALHIVLTHDVRPDDVSEILIVSSSKTPPLLPYHRPTTALEAKWSMEYCVASAVLDREVGPRQFTDAAVWRPAIRALIERTRYEHPANRPETWDSYMEADEIVVCTTDGRQLSHSVSLAPGMLMPIVSSHDLARKYRECTSAALPADRVEASLGRLLGLDDVSDINELTGLLSNA